MAKIACLAMVFLSFCAVSQAAFYCDFEGVPSTDLIGTNGWFKVASDWAVLIGTPGGGGGNVVLDGANSAYAATGVAYVARKFDNDPAFGDGSKVSFTFKLENFNTNFFYYITPDFSGTPLGIETSRVEGVNYLSAFGHPSVSNFATIDPAKTYKLSVQMDFTGQQFSVLLKNLTDNTPEATYGPFAWWAPLNAAAMNANGGIIIDTAGAGLYVDDFQIIPEPATLALLAMGVLSFIRRRTA